MKRDAHAGILRRRFESADFFLVGGIGEIEDDETVGAESTVAAIAAVFEFFGDVDGAM